MKYIGIRGHRGSGKKSFAVLLGNTLDILLNTPLSYRYYERDTRSMFDNGYEMWVHEIMTSPNSIPPEISNLKYVYLDSFGDIPKSFVQMMLGVSFEDLDNNDTKDNLIINLKDFSKTWRKDLPENTRILSSDEIYAKHFTKNDPAAITTDEYMTLREFVLYFGKEVMQRYLGLNVWIKALKANGSLFENIFDEETSYRIYGDVKTKSEVTYIKDHDGIIIKISRPTHKKSGRYVDDLRMDKRYDYEVKIDGDLMSIKEEVWRIANEIIHIYEHAEKESN